MYFELLNAVSYLERPDGMIAIPGLDTYCLAARPDHGAALARIHRVRRLAEPLLLLGCDESALAPFCGALPDTAKSLMRRYWPGALMLAVPAGNEVSEAITANRGQVRVMQPECPLLQSLLSMVPDGILALAPANRIGLFPSGRAVDVYGSFGEDVDYVLPGDDLMLEAIAPTVVSVQSNGEIHLLRSGGIVLD